VPNTGYIEEQYSAPSITKSVALQDFLVEDRLISPVGDHLTGSLAEPKVRILTRPSSCEDELIGGLSGYRGQGCSAA
jgi:hypothetical protein